MPLNAKGKKILAAMTEQYGDEDKAKEVFYASLNSGKIAGVHKAKDAVVITDADGSKWTRGAHLSDDDTLLDAVTKHRDGYLTCEARVARTGLQRYRGYEVGMPEREHVTLYRPPEEVFARDSMRSMANKPITLTHPPQMVDSKSWGKVAKGFSGSEVVRDGEYVRVPLMLTDAAAVEAFESGAARELSVGYTTDISWVPGETMDGVHYDGVQRLIRGNHHALVPVARGGSSLKFGDRKPTTLAIDELSATNDDDYDGLADLSDDWSEAARQAALEARQARAAMAARQQQFEQYGGSHAEPMQQATPEEEEEYEKALATIARRQKAGGRSAVKVAPGFQRAMARAEALPSSQSLDADPLTCPNCGAPVQADALSCPSCGYDIKPVPRAGEKIAMDAEPYWLADKEFSQEERKTLAEKGHALPGGGYPIRNRKDLGNAIQAFGRAKNPAATKALIKRRAKDLGAESMLPEDWQTDAADSGFSEESAMSIIRTFDGVPVAFADETSAGVMEREMRRLQIALADQEANFKGKKAKPFGKNGNGDDDNGNGNGNGKKKVGDQSDDDDDDAAAIEAKRKKVTAEDALAAKDGEIAVLKKQLADATLTDAKVEAIAAERIALLDAAAPLLPKGWSPVGKTLAEIRRAAVGVSMGDAEIKDWDDAQVIGAFRALTKTGGQKRDGAHRLADGMTNGMRDTANQMSGGGASLADAEKDAANAYAEYCKRITDGYKTPISAVRN